MNRDAARSGLPVLTYHAIGPERSVTATDPGRFAETLATLRNAGYRAVGLADWIARGRPDEPRGFAIAFDDGLRSILKVADALCRFRVPATVFLVTGRIGTNNAWPGQRRDVPIEPLLSWPEITTLAESGFEFGAHGDSHTRLDRLDAPGLRRELNDSRATIEDRLGRPCRLLAYPDGSVSPRVRQAAAEVFDAGFGTRLDYANGLQNPFDLARIDAYYLRTRHALDALIADGSRGWLRWRRALRAVRGGVEPVLASGRRPG